MNKPDLKVAASAEIKIEKGVPMRKEGRYGNKYPWRDMEVGDSFLFPAGLSESTYYGQAREFTKQSILDRDPKTFKAKKTPDGFRCWRIA